MDFESASALIGHVRSAGEWTVADLRGTIDYSNSRRLGEELDTFVGMPGLKLLLNLGQVNYLDTTALATLVDFRNRMTAAGGQMVLCRVPEGVRGLIRVTRLNGLFAIVADEAEILPQTAAGPAGE